MAHFELILNPQKALKRKDLIKVAKIMQKQIAKKDTTALILTITDDAKDGASKVTMPFPIIDD